MPDDDQYVAQHEQHGRDRDPALSVLASPEPREERTARHARLAAWRIDPDARIAITAQKLQQ